MSNTHRLADGAQVSDPRLARWERRMNPVIICAALIPIVFALSPRRQDDPFLFVDIGSWLVFLVDLIVHMRLQPGYLRRGIGKFDTAIVVLTFPWYLIPGLGGAAVLGLARLGRVLRLVLAGGTTGVLRRLVDRLGKAGLYSLALIFVCSVIVFRVEPPSSGFTTLGDALWWGFVTFTTVGYGDLVPVTSTGRLVAIFLMIGGIGLIGLLSGSLAEFLRGGGTAATDDDAAPAPDGTAADRPTPTAAGPADLVVDEVRALRSELAELRSLLALDGDTAP